MVEFDYEVDDEQYTDDVEIDFSKMSYEDKVKLLHAIITNDTFIFEDVDLSFSGTIYVCYEPW